VPGLKLVTKVEPAGSAATICVLVAFCTTRVVPANLTVFDVVLKFVPEIVSVWCV
jgi:hypothetical protein